MADPAHTVGTKFASTHSLPLDGAVPIDAKRAQDSEAGGRFLAVG